MNIRATRRLATIAAAATTLGLAAAAQAQTALTPNGSAIRITAPGTYKLMGNLVTQSLPTGMPAIDITVGGVTLDLNGFSVIGSGRVCSQTRYSWQISCSAAAPWMTVGIRAADGSTLRNGTVQGFEHGIAHGGGRIEDMNLRHNHFGIVQSNNDQPDNSRSALLLNRVIAEFNSAQALGLLNAHVMNSVIKSNEMGVVGATWVSVADSTVYRNVMGVLGATVHAVRVFDNGNDFPNGARTY